MNKQEKNISDIITLEATEDIVDIFLSYVIASNYTVGIIANKELIEYAMSESLKHDYINVRKVDLDSDSEDIEYMISIDADGDLVVQPVEYYNDKYFSAMESVYISMDGDVTQMTIDVCMDKDMDVVLFGYEDDICSCDRCECKCDSDKKGNSPTPLTSDTEFHDLEETFRINGKEVDKKTFLAALDRIENENNLMCKCLDERRKMLLGYCEVIDEMLNWKRLLGW